MSVSFTKGQMQDYVAVREFGLNWEDRKIKSVKIRIGDIITYDGDTASYTKTSGEKIVGYCRSLKSAIAVMGWMVLKGEETVTAEDKGKSTETLVPESAKDFDGLKGGSFDTFVGRGMEIIQEKNMIVRDVPNLKEGSKKADKKADLSVVGDQVDVKEVPADNKLIVNSSTTVARTSKHSTKIIKSDEFGSEFTQPITIKKAANETTKKKSLVVDGQIPRNLPEDMTLADVDKLKKTPVIKDEASQGGRVVRKVSKTPEVQQIEGITLRKVESPKEMTIKTTTGVGSTPISDAMDIGVVVGKVGEKIESKTVKMASAAKAEAAKAARKAAAATTQAMMEKEKVPVKIEQHDLAEIGQQIEELVKGSDDYLSMLPDNWSDMHWVQKEKFIRQLTNIEFIRFIKTVESVKAVQDACEKRIAELAEQK